MGKRRALMHPVYVGLPYPSSCDVPVTDFLDEKHQQITDRLNELKPLVEEYRRLEAAAAALDGVGGSSTRAVRENPPRPRGGPGGGVGRARGARAAAPGWGGAPPRPGRGHPRPGRPGAGGGGGGFPCPTSG